MTILEEKKNLNLIPMLLLSMIPIAAWSSDVAHVAKYDLNKGVSPPSNTLIIVV